MEEGNNQPANKKLGAYFDKSFCCLCLLQRPPTFLKKNQKNPPACYGGFVSFPFVDRGAKLISAKRWHNSSRIFAAAWIVVRSHEIFWRIILFSSSARQNQVKVKEAGKSLVTLVTSKDWVWYMFPLNITATARFP